MDFESEEVCQKNIEQIKIRQNKYLAKMNTDDLAPCAFVTVRTQIECRKLEEKWKRTGLQKFFNKLCCCFVDNIFHFKGNYIYAEVAPEYTDINWENLAVKDSIKYYHRGITILVATVTLLATFLCIYFTALWKIDVYKNKAQES